MVNLRNCLVLGGVLVTSVAMAQDVSQEVPGHGKINWTDKTITVTGSGAPSLKAANVAVARLGAERAAKMDAFRNILEAVKGAKVEGGKSAGDVMASSPQVKSKVEGVIRNFKVLDTKYYSDGGVDLIVQVPLSGVTDALVPAAGTKVGSGSANGTTGIIVNARGLKAPPALAPRLVNEKGKAIFTAESVKKDAVKRAGVCGYTKSVEAAKKDPRVGDKPLVVKALRAAAKGSADLVISDADAKKLTAVAGVLAEGSVVIVTD